MKLENRDEHVDLELAFKNWTLQEHERYLFTLEALEDVNTGRLISQEEIVAWANSLSEGQPPSPVPQVIVE